MELKPMLFNTEMVRAILSGQKTCTRRVVKPRVGGSLEVHEDVAGTPRLCEKCGTLCHGLKPPCRPGDILYVRETWSTDADGGYVYRTNYGTTEDDSFPQSMFKWRPSIHMPKDAARIFLRVTDVRAERLWKMNVCDVVAEGCPEYKYGKGLFKDFEKLWDSTIKPADINRYGWAANPWVWVISFERCEKPEENMGR